MSYATRRSILAFCYGIVFSGGAAVSAQQASPTSVAAASQTSGLEEIVVTARRREENLQDVPIAITAFSQRDVEAQQIVSPLDLEDSVASLSVTGATSQRDNSSYVIRGQGFAFGSGGPGVVTYLAEVPGINPQFFDLQSLQVLAGPQGTLFGRNATGGAILLVPQAPTDTFGGYVRVEGGDYNSRLLEGAINIPLVSDKVLLRLAGTMQQRDGFTYNSFDGHELDNVHHHVFRGTLTLKPWDGFQDTTLISYDFRDETSSNAALQAVPNFPAYNHVALCAPGGPNYNAAACAAASVNPFYSLILQPVLAQHARGPRTVDQNVPSSTYNSTQLLINTATYDVTPNLLLKNIFGDVRPLTRVQYDTDASPRDVLNVDPPANRHAATPQITDELQLQGKSLNSHLNWVTGAYYEHIYNPADDAGQNWLAVAVPAKPPFLYVGVLSGMVNKAESLSRALYASGTYHWDQGWDLTAGVRRTWDDRGARHGSLIKVPAYYICSVPIPVICPNSTPGAYVQVPAPPLAFPSLSGVPLGAEQSAGFSHTTYDLTLSYRLKPDWMVYLTNRSGYKAGGFNTTAPPGFFAFQPETLVDFELGSKAKWNLGGTQILVDAAIFRDDYKDIQRSQIVADPVLGIVTVTTNSAAATIQGAQIALQIVPSGWFDINIEYAYTDAKYTSWIYGANSNPATPAANSPGLNFSGNPIGGVSKNKLNVTPRLHVPLASGWGTINLQATISYASEFANTDTATVQQDFGLGEVPSHTLINARAEWANLAGSRASVYLGVTNLANRTYLQGASSLVPFNGSTSGYYAPPRMYTLGVRYDFGK